MKKRTLSQGPPVHQSKVYGTSDEHPKLPVRADVRDRSNFSRNSRTGNKTDRRRVRK